MKNKRITSAIATLALVIVGSFAVPAMATDEDTGGQCVPSDARTERIVHPAVTHPVTTMVTDVPAWDEVVTDAPAGWQRYSWTGGPHESNILPPAFRGADHDWQPNVKGDPHNIGAVGAYFRSNGGSGRGDWFYLEAVPATSHIVHHDATTREETVIITDDVAWTEDKAYPAIGCLPDDEDGIVREVVVEEDGIVPEVVVVVAPAAVVVAPAAVVVAPAAVAVAPAAVVVAPAAVAIAAAPRFTG